MIEQDVLLFKGPVAKEASHLAKCINPFSGLKGTKEQYEEAFYRLASKGLGKVSITKGKNNKEHVEFQKATVLEIAQSPELLDAFSSTVKFSHYEANRTCFDSPVPQSLCQTIEKGIFVRYFEKRNFLHAN